MDLQKQCELAVFNLHIAHHKRDLEDYLKVLECYRPDVKMFDVIIEKVEELTNKIEALENEKNT